MTVWCNAFELVEGDSFNQLRLTRSERSIRNPGFSQMFRSKFFQAQVLSSQFLTLKSMKHQQAVFRLVLDIQHLTKAHYLLVPRKITLGTGRGARANFTISDKKPTSVLVSQNPISLIVICSVALTSLSKTTIFRRKIEQQGGEFGLSFKAITTTGTVLATLLLRQKPTHHQQKPLQQVVMKVRCSCRKYHIH